MSILINTSDINILTFPKTGIVNVILRGAGGGGGGNDAGSRGGRGGNGNILNAEITVNAGDVLYAQIGQPGTGGPGDSDFNGDRGGIGGRGVLQYNGGTGGIAGFNGSSGNGGGGGGATGIYKVVNGVSIPIVIAGGGGGGGGAGLYSAGSDHPNYPTLRHAVPYQYYSAVTLHYAWGSFMNTYAVARSGGADTLNYEVFFPESKNYTFVGSVDDGGNLSLDNVNILDISHFSTTYSSTRFVTSGWHKVSAYYSNFGGGPTGVAFAIYNNDNVMFSSRDAYNSKTVQEAAIITLGQDGFRPGHDGGGGGAGGGGYPAGAGGSNTSGGDGGAGFGSSGFNYVNRSFAKNLSTSIASYPEFTSAVSNLGIGGVANSGTGTAGYIMLEAGQRDIRINNKTLSNEWDQLANKVFYRQNDNWTEVKEVYVMHNGVFKRLHGIDDPTATTSPFNFYFDTALPLAQTSNYYSQQQPFTKYGSTGIWEANQSAARFLRSYLVKTDSGRLKISAAVDDVAYIYLNGVEVLAVNINQGTLTAEVDIPAGNNVITLFGINGPGPGVFISKIEYIRFNVDATDVINLAIPPSTSYRSGHDVFQSGLVPLVGKQINIPNVGVVTVTGFGNFSNTNGFSINTTNGSYIYYDYQYTFDGHSHGGNGFFRTPELQTEINAGRARLFDISPFSDVPTSISNGTRRTIGRQGYIFINPSFDPFPTIF